MASNAPNWLGLLKWSLAHTDGTSPSAAAPMSDEDKLFLESVMREAIKDEPKRMSEIMNTFVGFLESNSIASEQEQVQALLEELKDIVDHIDMAQIFVKFGGLECLLQMVERADSVPTVVRGNAAAVLGTICQNNITVQDEVYRKGTTKRLANVYSSADSSQLRAKILFSMSCIVRQHAAAEVQFAHEYAVNIFTEALRSDNFMLLRRTLFFGAALLASESISLERVQSLASAFVPATVNFLQSDDLDVREASFNVLRTILETKAGACRGVVLAHRSLLEPILDTFTVDSSAEAGGEITQEQHEMRLVSELRASMRTAPSSAHNPTGTVYLLQEGPN